MRKNYEKQKKYFLVDEKQYNLSFLGFVQTLIAYKKKMSTANFYEFWVLDENFMYNIFIQ